MRRLHLGSSEAGVQVREWVICSFICHRFNNFRQFNFNVIELFHLLSSTDCNYTCHSRCRQLVTLDCRSAGSSLASGEFPAMYPKLLDGTLGTIPKDLHLPPIPLHSPFGDSDKENDHSAEVNFSFFLWIAVIWVTIFSSFNYISFLRILYSPLQRPHVQNPYQRWVIQ